MQKKSINESMIIENSLKGNINGSLINDGDRRALLTAERLMERFSNPKGFKFYYKVGYWLPECVIWRVVEYIDSQRKGGKIRNEAKYFSKAINRELQKLHSNM